MSAETWTKHINLYFHRDLCGWARSMMLQCESAYSALESLTETRKSKSLKIVLAPWEYLLDRAGVGVLAFYEPSEDAVFLPAHWIFPVSFTEPFTLYLLFHEIGHAFIPSRNLPKFLQEGLASYFSLYIFNASGLSEQKARILSRQDYYRDPINDPQFNSTQFFEWNTTRLRYSNAFFVVNSLFDKPGPNSVRKFFNTLDNKDVDFSRINEKDRYDVLMYYLSASTEEDASVLFREYGLSANPSRLVFAIQVIASMLFTAGVLLFFLYVTAGYSAWRSREDKQGTLFKFKLVLIIVLSILFIKTMNDAIGLLRHEYLALGPPLSAYMRLNTVFFGGSSISIFMCRRDLESVLRRFVQVLKLGKKKP